MGTLSFVRIQTAPFYRSLYNLTSGSIPNNSIIPINRLLNSAKSQISPPISDVTHCQFSVSGTTVTVFASNGSRNISTTIQDIVYVMP